VILYLGLRPPKEDYIHFPVIRIEPLPFDQYQLIDESDWIFFTSQSLLDIVKRVPPRKVVFSIGEVTASALRRAGIHVDFIAKEETQEGMIELLKTLSFTNKKIFCGRSSLARPCLKEFLQGQCTFYDPVLYNTVIAFDKAKRPPLTSIKEVIFTSPSTVDGFKEAYLGEKLPKGLKLTAIGPVTEKKLLELRLHRLDIQFLAY